MRIWSMIIWIFFVAGGRTVDGQAIDRARLFEQMDHLLPAPNACRTGAGSPGADYWQQWVQYTINVLLDEQNTKISGSATIVYHNNAPVALDYLWLHLDQNTRSNKAGMDAYQPSEIKAEMALSDMRRILGPDEEHGLCITALCDTLGQALRYTINKTMLRVDLQRPLDRGSTFAFSVEWEYPISDRSIHPGRSGKEHFPDDGNFQFNMAQFYPRMAVYSDLEGWHNRQYIGAGEFSAAFGSYTVSITVPSDHVVGATGTLVNTDEVLTDAQLARLNEAQRSENPVFIVTPAEAVKAEQQRSPTTRTWIFRADSVRDFAFVSSRKLIWDAMNVEAGGRDVMVMSMYPKEAMPLYSEYSTRVAAHAVRFYSDYLFPFPYHKVTVVEADMGMEYPMLAFAYGRPVNGKYKDWLKRAMISVVIHEVGHNYFPMVINSDERQWAWMDEGLNSFVQYLAEQAWEPQYPSRRGPPVKVIPYMKRAPSSMVPIMSNPEQLVQKGNNAYLKTATALNVLREVVMGRALFDYAFRTYCRRWAFRHPSPADFFRTMEDASAVDLDWFWKGWFYTTDPVDIELSNVRTFIYQDGEKGERAKSKSGVKTKGVEKKEAASKPDKGLGHIEYYELSDGNGVPEKGDWLYYEVRLSNIGGLPSPVLIQFEFEDGSSEFRKLPAEIWRYDQAMVRKVFAFARPVKRICLDPENMTADIDASNNCFP